MSSFAHGSSVEAAFKAKALSKGWRVSRAGWPDFFIANESGVEFVEVKSEHDRPE